MTNSIPLIIAALTVTLFLLITFPASAQSVCGARSKVITELLNGFSETPRAMGLASNGSMLELLTSEDGT